MNEKLVTERILNFGVRIFSLARYLGNESASEMVSHAVLSCVSSMHIRYRAACRAGDDAVFSASMIQASDSAEEFLFWLELVEKTGIIRGDRLKDLKGEAEELLVIFTSEKKPVPLMRKRKNRK
jgi:four helix bundle protein